MNGGYKVVAFVVREELDLDGIFPGGLAGELFTTRLTAIRSDVAEFQARLQAGVDLGVDAVAALADRIHQTGVDLSEAMSFANLVLQADTGNGHARLASGQVQQLAGTFQVLLTQVDRLLTRLSPEEFDQLLDLVSSGGLADALRERRSRTTGVPVDQEAAIKALATDGFQGWTEVYQTVNRRTTISWEENGESRSLPVTTAQAMLPGMKDPAMRERMAAKIGEAYAQESPLLAATLNHRAGFRVASYRLRGWDSVLQEALLFGRLKEETLQTMWAVAMAHQAPLHAYFRRKANLLGTSELAYHDLLKPVSQLPPLTWAETAARITSYFEGFSPDMGTFGREMFAGGCFDLGDGPGRQPGISQAFVFPRSRTSRIFLNHKHAPTLVAHETGHAYSCRSLWDSGLFARMQEWPMTLLEVPSTFSQILVGKALVRDSSSKEERIAWLDELCMMAGLELCVRRGHFLFEKAMYEARLQGPLGAEPLCSLYHNALTEATRGTLRAAHPYGWVSPYFMVTHVPFYNFPYTVALLLSAGLYARWSAEGASFADRYPTLIADIGRLSVEEIAQRHLGADLSRPDFWESAIAVLLEDVQEFLELTETR